MTTLNRSHVILAIVASAALFAVLSIANVPDALKLATGFATSIALLFVRPEKVSADTGGRTIGAGALSAGGDDASLSNTASSDPLKLKQALLTRWALDGQQIDDATEAKAEIVAAEILERSQRALIEPKKEETTP